MEKCAVEQKSFELEVRARKAAIAYAERRGYEIIDDSQDLSSETPFSFVAIDGQSDTTVFVIVLCRTKDQGLAACDFDRKTLEEAATKWLEGRSDEEKDCQTIRFDEISMVVIDEDHALLRHNINILGS